MPKLNIRNFRDIQGYKNKNGLIMKPNKIFRGGPLDSITKEEANYLENELKISYILDFRDEKEAKLSPNYKFSKAKQERISALTLKNKIGFDFASFIQKEMNEENQKQLMNYLLEGYRTMPFNNPAYHALFDILLKNEGSIYFHCTAGKDRTGIAAFLIMMALGMNEEDAIQEYLLSNRYLKQTNKELCDKLGIHEKYRKACEPFLFVCQDFIQITIQEIKNKYPSYDEFLEKEYQLTKDKRDKLRKIYCQ